MNLLKNNERSKCIIKILFTYKTTSAYLILGQILSKCTFHYVEMASGDMSVKEYY